MSRAYAFAAVGLFAAGALLAAGVQQLRIHTVRAEHVANVAELQRTYAQDSLTESKRLLSLTQRAIEAVAPLRQEQHIAYENLTSLLTGVRSSTDLLRQQSSATNDAIRHLSAEAAKQTASACTALLTEMAAVGSAMADAIGQSTSAADGHYADDTEKSAGWPSAPSQP